LSGQVIGLEELRFRGLLGTQLLDGLPFGFGEAFHNAIASSARSLAGILRSSESEEDIDRRYRGDLPD
jgi:hypothetical protein